MTEPMNDAEFALFKEPVGSINDVRSAEWLPDGTLLVRSSDNLWFIREGRPYAERVATYLRGKGITVLGSGL